MKGVSVITQNQTQRKPAQRLVPFQYLDPRAYAVSLAGTFNDWHPTNLPMINSGTGLWTRNLPLLPGRYEYSLVVDGYWIPDPRCAEKMESPFGDINSVLRVKPLEERPA